MKTVDQLLKALFGRLEFDPVKLAVLVLGFFYGAGYLIQAITLRNYGIYRLETVKLHYIEVGLTFTVLTLLISVMPAACYVAHFRIRRRSQLPHYRIGAVGYLANTYNLLFLVVCFALFITKTEWNATILRIGAQGLPLSTVFLSYAGISVFVLVCLPLIERWVVVNKAGDLKIYWILIEPARYLAVLTGLSVNVLLIDSFPWIGSLLVRGLTFAFSAWALAAIAYVIVFYMRKLGDSRSLHVLTAISVTGLLLLTYICINAYVFSVVRHIPMNRGGKLPLTHSYIAAEHDALDSIGLHTQIEGRISTIGPVYVLEETADYIHVADADTGNWHSEWATTYAIQKSSVFWIKNERIESGGPRASR